MNILHTLKDRMFGRLQRDVTVSGEHIGELKHTFGHRLAEFRENRSRADQQAVAEDFDQLLTAWGIARESDVPAVCRELKLRLLLFALPVVVLSALALWQQSTLIMLTLLCFALPGIVGVLTTLWRLSILKNRQFTPFAHWLGAGFALGLCLVSLCAHPGMASAAISTTGAFPNGADSYIGGTSSAGDTWNNNTVTISGAASDSVQTVNGAYLYGTNAATMSGNTVSAFGLTITKSIAAGTFTGNWRDSIKLGMAENNSLVLDGITMAGQYSTYAYGIDDSMTPNSRAPIYRNNTIEAVNIKGRGDLYAASVLGGLVENNHVTIRDSQISSATGAWGGGKNVGNGATIINSSTDFVYGANTRDGEMLDNHVSVTDSTFTAIYGALQTPGMLGDSYFYSTGDLVGNSVVVTNSKSDESWGVVYGALTGSNTNVRNNTVTIRNSEIAEGIFGGSANPEEFGGWPDEVDWASAVTGNVVDIVDSKVHNVTGGQIGIYGGSSLSDNSVSIANSEVRGDVRGAHSYGDRGAVDGIDRNSVSLTDTTVTGNVFGGHAETPDTPFIRNSTINLTNTTITGNLMGGVGVGAGDYRTGNALWVRSRNNTVGGHTGNFSSYYFILPHDVKNGDIMLRTASADIDHAKVGFVIAGGGMPLNAGDTVYLIKSDAVLANTFTDVSPDFHIQQGVSLFYDYWMGLIEDDKSLVIRIPGGETSVHVNPQTKALSEGWLAGLATLNTGADMIAGAGMEALKAAIMLEDDEPTYVPFGIMQGGYSRYTTGSYLDISTLNMLGGIGFRYGNIDRGFFYLAPFLEAGWGSYDTHNDFPGFPTVDGRGHTSYYGGGVMGRYEKPLYRSIAWAEGAFHLGNLNNDYLTDDLKDGFGRRASYEASAPYHAYHLGLGYRYDLSETDNLDFYAKYYMTRVYGTDVSVLGDPIVFGDITSKRLRAGLRWTHDHEAPQGICFRTYLGGAYEREFDGRLHATTYGYDMPRPALTGDSGMAEVGLKIKHLTSNVSLDLNVQGFAGTRRGYQGNMTLKWEF